MTLRRRASVVCVYKAKILAFNAVDPTSGKKYFFLPGGAMEDGESPLRCCEREAMEETGYKVKAIQDSEIFASYEFFWNGVLYNSETYFYKGVLDEPWHKPKPVIDVDYNKGVLWLFPDQIEKAFAYTAEILNAVKELSK